MVLLGIDSLLLLYITSGLGIFMLTFLQRIFKHPAEANTLGVVLLGLIFSTFYFSLVSFWFPVNYFCLIPLLALSSFSFIKNTEGRKKFSFQARQNLQLIFSPANLWFCVPVIAMLFYYWIIPPANPDSADYHYTTILWYEKYKVVPGLANVHGRFAFNSAAFIIQAAYAFTAVAGQSLYPLNGLIISLFVLWLLTRVLRNKSSFAGIVYAVIFFLLTRDSLINLSSPSSDPLFTICITYVLIKYFDVLLLNKITVSLVLVPVLITLYAFIAKLSAYSLILTIPFILYHLRKTEKLLPFLLKLFIICLPLYITWFCRNIILSGYLIYPLPYIDIFNVDWKAPRDILMVDYFKIKHEPKVYADIGYLKSVPFPRWIYPWLSYRVKNYYAMDVYSFLLAVFSPFYWIAVYIKRRKISSLVFMLWLFIYAGVWLWLINSPEFRFGTVFFSLSITLPFLYFAVTGVQKKYPLVRIALITICIISSVHYIRQASKQESTYAFSPKDYWLLPLKDKHYYYHNNKSGFKYMVINNGVKLYLSDSAHECLNTDQPCMMWRYGTIEMRGNKMDDGFRNVKDEVSKYYPYVK